MAKTEEWKPKSYTALLSAKALKLMKDQGKTPEEIERLAACMPGVDTAVARFSREACKDVATIQRMLDAGMSLPQLRDYWPQPTPAQISEFGEKQRSATQSARAQGEREKPPQKPLTPGRRTCEIFDPRGVTLGGTHTTYDPRAK